MKEEVFAIHGFLGSSADWDEVFPSSFSVTSCDLYASTSGSPPENYDLCELGNWVNQKAVNRVNGAGPQILVGYSLGGRIVLHALLQAPENWKGAVIVSAHPGLQSLSEKQTRLENDERWAQRFENENWDEVIDAWNQQPVFQGTGVLRQNTHPQRVEKRDLRKRLAQSLRQASLANQKDLRPLLKNLDLPILWISGERDAKFAELHKDVVKLNSNYFEAKVLPGAGHRVPWDQKKLFQKAVLEFFAT